MATAAAQFRQSMMPRNCRRASLAFFSHAHCLEALFRVIDRGIRAGAGELLGSALAPVTCGFSNGLKGAAAVSDRSGATGLAPQSGSR
jgi:hypothetical protein